MCINFDKKCYNINIGIMKKILLHLGALFVLYISASCSTSYLDDCDILGIGGVDGEIFKQPGWKNTLSSYLSDFSSDLNTLNLSYS